MERPPPKSSDQPTLRDHTYDGIQEYDQKLPNWWLFTWYAAMVWSVIGWLAYYQLGYGKSNIEAIDQSIALLDATRLKELESITDEKLWAMSQDAQIVSAGQSTYVQSCQACHSADLRGRDAGPQFIGLPLADHVWKHGGHPTQIMALVRKGNLLKGMPPWEPQLGVKRVSEVVAYILSKHQAGEPIELAPDSPLLPENQTASDAAIVPAATSAAGL